MKRSKYGQVGRLLIERLYDECLDRKMVGLIAGWMDELSKA